MTPSWHPVHPIRSPRYEEVTETTGGELTAEAADMMATRYRLAAAEGQAKRVLEIGCGAGLGFGLVAREAQWLVGGDYSAALLRSARAHYGDRVPLVRLSAEHLPFPSAAFDVVLFFEASYYVPRMEAAFDEIARILAPGGRVMFVNANPERPDFIRSPHSLRYHSADEFRGALEQRGFAVTVEGGFPVRDRRTGLSRGIAKIIPLARRLLEAFHLVPRTLQGRARLKRLLYRHLVPIPPEIGADFGTPRPRYPVGSGPVPEYKVLYVTGRKHGG